MVQIRYSGGAGRRGVSAAAPNRREDTQQLVFLVYCANPLNTLPVVKQRKTILLTRVTGRFGGIETGYSFVSNKSSTAKFQTGMAGSGSAFWPRR